MIGLYFSGDGGHERPHILGLSLDEGREHHRAQAQLFRCALCGRSAVRQGVDLIVCILGKGLGCLAGRATGGEIPGYGRRQAAVEIVLFDAGQSVLKGGLVRAHGRAVVVLPRYGNVPGGRIGHGIADVEADEFRSPVRNPLGHPASVHAGDVAAHRVDLQDSSAGFQQNIRGLLLIL